MDREKKKSFKRKIPYGFELISKLESAVRESEKLRVLAVMKKDRRLMFAHVLSKKYAQEVSRIIEDLLWMAEFSRESKLKMLEVMERLAPSANTRSFRRAVKAERGVNPTE
jgi:hypothetical protein